MNENQSMGESAIRRRALCRGYRVFKSRGHQHANNLGKFQLVDRWHNVVVLGDFYEAELQDIAEFLSDKPATNGYPS
jgi:hypothetical protein